MTFLLLLIIAHFLCDFTILSTKKMLMAKQNGKDFEPIFCHGLVHGIAFAIITHIFFGVWYAIFVLFFETITHSVIDYLKAKCNVWMPTAKNPAGRLHWFLFGFDQLLHYIVILSIFFMKK